MRTLDYKSLEISEVFKSLQTSEIGLSEVEVQKRQRDCGFNEIKEIRKNPLVEFVKRYWGPMPWLLEFSIFLTAYLNHLTESIIIFVLLTANAVIGYMQSQNSQKAVALLKKKLEIKVKVYRDGEWKMTHAKDLVAGDILNLRLGDLVPCDLKIMSGKVSADESSLTGESLPKELGEGDILFSGSVIKRGDAKAVAVNIAANTFFGKTVELVKMARPTSKQEALMLSIVKDMMVLGILASLLTTCFSILWHKDLVFILSFAVIFLIGSIPVALPAVLTVVQAFGSMELAKKGVLVTRLDSIEDAASLDVFCFDKTGTITQNRLTVMENISYEGYTREDVLRLAALASQREDMDAIDLSIFEAADQASIDFSAYRKTNYIPFSPERKRTSAIVETAHVTQIIIKGAVQTILDFCTETDPTLKQEVLASVESMSKKGYRSIAVAISDPDHSEKYDLVGLLGISDPPREDSASMIKAIKDLGIKILMLTGDNRAIAQEVSKQVGIGDKIIQAADLAALDHAQQLELIENSDGFAEVYPEDKFRIVKLLQDHSHVVGMTGDGVNDSPALKQAELGTAVSEATDVAKASASIVLTRPGLSEIIEALRISRKTYQRMLTWVINKITKVVEVILLFTVGFFLFRNVLVSLLGMSLLVFANDFVTMSIATDKVKSTDSPNHWNIRRIMAASMILGAFFALEDLMLVLIGTQVFALSFEKLQTLVLISLVFNTQFRILIVRERNHFWSSRPDSRLLWINLLTIIGFAILGCSGFLIPGLTIPQVLVILVISIVFMILIDFIKVYIFKVFHIN